MLRTVEVVGRALETANLVQLRELQHRQVEARLEDQRVVHERLCSHTNTPSIISANITHTHTKAHSAYNSHRTHAHNEHCAGNENAPTTVCAGARSSAIIMIAGLCAKLPPNAEEVESVDAARAATAGARRARVARSALRANGAAIFTCSVSLSWVSGFQWACSQPSTSGSRTFQVSYGTIDQECVPGIQAFRRQGRERP